MKEREMPKTQIETKNINHLEDNLPRGKRGQIRWSRIPQEEIIIYLEEKARALLQEKESLNRANLNKNKMKWFVSAVEHFYPGGLCALKKKHNQPVNKPHGYWQRPEAIEEMKLIAFDLFKQAGKVSKNVFEELDRSALSYAITHYYPGGYSQLIEDLGGRLKLMKDFGYKSFRGYKDYWSKIDILKQESILFVKEHGDITNTLLRDNKRTDLYKGIHRYYPGGLMQLRIDFGIVTALPYVDKQTRVFIDKNGTIWTTCQVVAERIGMSSTKVKSYLQDHNIDSIKGLVRNNNPAILYNEAEALALLESIKTGEPSKIDSEEPNKWFQKLLKENKI